MKALYTALPSVIEQFGVDGDPDWPCDRFKGRRGYRPVGRGVADNPEPAVFCIVHCGHGSGRVGRCWDRAW